MAKKKPFGVNALSEALERKDAGDTITAEKPRPASGGKSVSSPINAPSMRGGTQRIQRFYIDLPVSRQTTECELKELDPRDCVPSPLNKRVQSLLNLSDPGLRQLMESMRDEGQRDPVLARPSQRADGSVAYEIIYGTRRRYVAEKLTAEQGALFPLKAWISTQISDLDAKRLADSENEDREAISAWEMAQYFQRYKNEHPELNLEALAALEGVDASSVSRYLQIAQLPEGLVALVPSPTEISLRAGIELARLWKQHTARQQTAVLAQLQDEAPFPDAGALQRALKRFGSKPKAAPARSEKQEILDRQGEKKAVLGAHRSKAGHYKIDLLNISQAQFDSIQASLKKILR